MIKIILNIICVFVLMGCGKLIKTQKVLDEIEPINLAFLIEAVDSIDLPIPIKDVGPRELGPGDYVYLKSTLPKLDKYKFATIIVGDLARPTAMYFKSTLANQYYMVAFRNEKIPSEIYGYKTIYKQDRIYTLKRESN